MQRKCNKKRSRVGEVGNEGKIGESQFICSSSNFASYIQILFIFKNFNFFTAQSIFKIFDTICSLPCIPSFALIYFCPIKMTEHQLDELTTKASDGLIIITN